MTPKIFIPKMQKQCNALEDMFMNTDFREAKKEKKPKRKVKKEEKEVVNGSVSSEGSEKSRSKSDMYKTPYRHKGEIVYIVNVDQKGKFVRSFEPEDFQNLRGRKGGMYEWMVSSPGRSKDLYSVVINEEGKILYGVKGKEEKCL